MNIKSRTENLRILLVDDSVLMRNILTGYLNEYGAHDIKFAPDGDIAIREIEESLRSGNLYNIVFLDWNMPGKTGFDVLTHFRAQKAYDKMAIVMVTAENKQKNVLEAIRAGATAYMIKPVSKVDLDAKMIQILNWLERNNK